MSVDCCYRRCLQCLIQSDYTKVIVRSRLSHSFRQIPQPHPSDLKKHCVGITSSALREFLYWKSSTSGKFSKHAALIGADNWELLHVVWNVAITRAACLT